jgi:putative PIN family toxin of toxin-antitoxin system
MLRVVLDANVFVSAVLKPQSNLARILELVKEGKIKLVISGDILSEIRSVLLYPKIRKRHCRTPKEVDKFLEKTVRVSFITSGRMNLKEIKEDPEDNKYLSAAVEGKADFIISGDHHLKDLRIYQGIRILDPSTFLKLMAKSIER